MAIHTETIEVTGIRCERCVMRLGATLRDLDGLEAANANLVGEVTLSWDDGRIDREAILARLAQGGFHPVAAG
ncbi:MAG TPA: cation transporter [Gaiellaceae bacterium]|nr:cation transporter [Gaiellaceae bacterium]